MRGNPLFLNSEFQRTQRAKVKRSSLVASGKLGYAATCKAGKQHIASKKAAEWRREHPTCLERWLISHFMLLEVPFAREVECSGFFIDFEVRNYAIEANGAQWHEKEELRPGQKQRDKRKYQTLADNGYTVIVLPESEIRTGGAWQTLYKLFGGCS